MEKEEDAEVVFMAPSSYRAPDDSNNQREFEQVVTLVSLGDGRLKITKIGGIPIAEPMDDEEEPEMELEEEEEVEVEDEPQAPGSLQDAIAQERAMRGV